MAEKYTQPSHEGSEKELVSVQILRTAQPLDVPIKEGDSAAKPKATVKLVLSEKELALLREMMGSQMAFEESEAGGGQVAVTGDVVQIRNVLNRLASLTENLAPTRIQAEVSSGFTGGVHQAVSSVTLVLDPVARAYLPATSSGGTFVADLKRAIEIVNNLIDVVKPQGTSYDATFSALPSRSLFAEDVLAITSNGEKAAGSQPESNQITFAADNIALGMSNTVTNTTSTLRANTVQNTATLAPSTIVNSRDSSSTNSGNSADLGNSERWRGRRCAHQYRSYRGCTADRSGNDRGGGCQLHLASRYF